MLPFDYCAQLCLKWTEQDARMQQYNYISNHSNPYLAISKALQVRLSATPTVSDLLNATLPQLHKPFLC